eukprot:1049555-Pleurochrysis_carterae.AAC.1
MSSLSNARTPSSASETISTTKNQQSVPNVGSERTKVDSITCACVDRRREGGERGLRVHSVQVALPLAPSLSSLLSL